MKASRTMATQPRLQQDLPKEWKAFKQSKCDSNLLSAYSLAIQHCGHFQSKSGDFLHFIGENIKLLFAAVAIGEVDYLPSAKLAKTKVFSAQIRKFTDTLKEWHLRLGPVEREPTEPLHTLRVDSTGKLKVNGLYGSFGHRYALAVVDDATAFKWYIQFSFRCLKFDDLGQLEALNF
ncbi:hypothetical protein PHMEG_00029688 [Phytophthora megakarya]|uniref:Uncharacterized protein n=1 Tax=Phytophthora megakarya TaxID=4795 RepID=A0A225V210_9STRA|nr:hypothetical protein PHMEG_00029688 [Phytophthora megakarya]